MGASDMYGASGAAPPAMGRQSFCGGRVHASRERMDFMEMTPLTSARNLEGLQLAQVPCALPLIQ